MKQFDRHPLPMTPETVRAEFEAPASQSRSIVVAYRVYGFGGKSPVTVRIDRKSEPSEPLRIGCTIHDESRARDTKEVPDDADAYHNLAAAFLDACTLMEFLRRGINREL